MDSKIKSYSVVGNQRTMRELALLVASIRRFTDTKICVMTDEVTSRYLQSLPFATNLHIKEALNKSDLDALAKQVAFVIKQNNFHDAGIIYSKMDCISWAVQTYGNTMFVDADVVFIRDPSAHINLDVDLILSPHYHVEKKAQQNKRVGIFNAGYLWTQAKDFGKVWQDIYLTKSSFYEQQGMYRLMEHFDTQVFNKKHNIGFWRFKKQWHQGKLDLLYDENLFSHPVSLHFHAFEENYSKADAGLRAGYNKLKEICWKYLPDDLKGTVHAL